MPILRAVEPLQRRETPVDFSERGELTVLGLYFSTHGTALSAVSVGLEEPAFLELEAAAARALLLKNSAILQVRVRPRWN